MELSECTYASKALGNLAYYDEDSMRCDCSYDPGQSSFACSVERS